MKNGPKLPEKDSRFAEVRQGQWDEIISKYLKDMDPENSESARSHRFVWLLNEFFRFQPDFIDSYISGFEKYIRVKQKDRILKGRADNLFGNVIIEFEKNLYKKRSEAEEQLRRYVAILWMQESPERHTPYLCIATDGIHFIAYSPILEKPSTKEEELIEVSLKKIDEIDLRKLKSDEVYYWLDRYFLRKKLLSPTSEAILKDFGSDSHAFQTTTQSLLALWQEIKGQSDYEVIYESWGKYLRIVYGSEVGGDELFIRHTYLATLAKLMGWARITESTSPPEDSEIAKMLLGELFKQNIENYIEEDFFSWLGREEALKVSISVVRRLFSLLHKYNLRGLSEDVLKSLYQELVDPRTRHDLGEFYTPDWLAHRIVNRLLDKNPQGAMLDPACGSGTFLYWAIREKIQRLGPSQKTLRHILDSVQGADIHPLAVIIAKNLYILALGDLLTKYRRGKISIPIYLSNTMKLPEKFMKTETAKYAEYIVDIDDRSLYLPEWLVENITLGDQAIEQAKEFARENKGEDIEVEPFRNFLMAQPIQGIDNEEQIRALFKIVEELKHFIDADRDTIWAYILKNIYKPLFFKGKYDFIMGNPPWIAFRYMEPEYQKFVKRQIIMEYELLTGRGELITHLEVATLFLLRSADLYLKPGGAIAFVLPRSIFSADQHDGLRKGAFKFSEPVGAYCNTPLLFREVWDCEDVQPLFNVPACVVIAEKQVTGNRLQVTGYWSTSIAGQILRAKLQRKNASLMEAEKALKVEDVEFFLHTQGKRSFWATSRGTLQRAPTQTASFYKKRFAQGATIVPRSFWFVEVKASPLGIDPHSPPLVSAPRAMEQAKAAYKNLKFEGNVESKFLYATLLSTDLLPFGHLEHRLVVLPIEPEEDHYRLINAEEANQKGFLNLARWLEKAEEEWAKRRGAKAELMSIYQRLNRYRGLTAQNPQANYRVIYNTSGTFLTVALVENEPIEFEINEQQIIAHRFVADTKTYYCELNIKNEAFFLVAILNAPEIDKMIKPMQSRGQWGPRDIHKKVLELPIPQFDPQNPGHHRLSELGMECTEKVEGWLAMGGPGKIKSIGKLRSMVRQILKDELKEIDGLVGEVLEGTASST